VLRLRDIDGSEHIELNQLALGHPPRHVREQVKHVEVPLVERNLECLHVEPVAHEDADLVTPGHVDGRSTAAHLRVVDDVVVN
jgi:hypothetical protein